MAIYTNQPSLDQLKRAVAVSEQIKTLEAELASILSGSAVAKEKVTGSRRGRPAGSKNVVSALLSAVAAPKGRKPAKKKRAMSEEGRKKIAEAQRKRWAEKKKNKG